MWALVNPVGYRSSQVIRAEEQREGKPPADGWDLRARGETGARGRLRVPAVVTAHGWAVSEALRFDAELGICYPGLSRVVGGVTHGSLEKMEEPRRGAMKRASMEGKGSQLQEEVKGKIKKKKLKVDLEAKVIV